MPWAVRVREVNREPAYGLLSLPGLAGKEAQHCLQRELLSATACSVTIFLHASPSAAASRTQH